jgi:3alpha(or 20beta)-hydroxysteroid dehydrogenase
VSADYVADVVLNAMRRKSLEIFMPANRARAVRLLGTNPRSLKKLVIAGEAIGAERLKARRESKGGPA